jgi:hypothetical protein
MVKLDLVKRFAALFAGRTDAYGTNKGGWVKSALTQRMYSDHLNGLHGAGIGVAPLLDDGTVNFAAIDLDEPNFELAMDVAALIPGDGWLERSRSGNAHLWYFFSEPCPAWVARGQLRQALEAVGRRDVEIFPKQAQLREGMLGNNINLPLYGEERPILWSTGDEPEFATPGYTIEGFVHDAEVRKVDVDHWTNLCRQDGIEPPALRITDGDEFGERKSLHGCARYIIEHADDNPLAPGHRHVVLFNLAKMYLNCADYDFEDVLAIVSAFNDRGEVPLAEREVLTTIQNAARGRWRSTGCDDPVMSPYIDPNCPIARG